MRPFDKKCPQEIHPLLQLNRELIEKVKLRIKNKQSIKSYIESLIKENLI
jgi:hypothetical protein